MPKYIIRGGSCLSYIVIKCGGSVLDKLPDTFYKNIVELMEQYHLKPIVVHGGGPVVSNLLQTLDVQTTFVNGMRVTTEEILDVVEMGLSGIVNKKIVREITAQNGRAIGLSGVDNMTLEAEPLASNHKLGYVGQVASVHLTGLNALLDKGIIPVLSPLAVDQQGQRWNINADLAAAAVATTMQASLYMITDVDGVLHQDTLVPKLSAQEAEEMIDSGSIYGGMIPKVQAALNSIEAGVRKVVILNGAKKNSLMDFFIEEKTGTVFESVQRRNKQTVAEEVSN
ncbi:acetylglutamate kinase [Lentibacillus cibarius]|uniref:Acetylglutamate kinase n=1 Tax=Lentibacillus cibarius TaxID=2583219 RepID=A0A549YL81_9BACI|nr:acetylglutamate kinase [Lentibacillus cibarius]